LTRTTYPIFDQRPSFNVAFKVVVWNIRGRREAKLLVAYWYDFTLTTHRRPPSLLPTHDFTKSVRLPGPSAKFLLTSASAPPPFDCSWSAAVNTPLHTTNSRVDTNNMSELTPILSPEEQRFCRNFCIFAGADRAPTEAKELVQAFRSKYPPQPGGDYPEQWPHQPGRTRESLCTRGQLDKVPFPGKRRTITAH